MTNPYVKVPLEQKIVKPPQQKESLFLLTINTLKVDYDPETLNRVITDWYNSDDFEMFVKYKDTTKKGPEYIDEVSMKFQVERGKKLHRIHAHIIITFKHRTKIHLDLERIRAYFKIALRLENIHVDVKWFKGRTDVDSYIFKTLQQE